MRKALTAVALAALVLPAVPAGAQQNGSIGGTVTAEAGSPLTGICVVAFSETGEGTTTTGSGGTYTLAGLTPGSYLVGFNICPEGDNDDAYAWEWWQEAAGFAAAREVVVDHGQAVTGIDATLPAAGHITGAVTDETAGGGVAGICVTAIEPDELAFAQEETTADGTYDLPVRAGTYIVTFADCTAPRLHLAEAYDDVGLTDTSEPTTVAVTAGQTVTGIDAALARGGAVAGRVIASHTGAAVPGVCAEALDTATGAFLWSGFTGEEGTDEGAYSVGGLPPGRYDIVFDCHPGFGEETYPSPVTVQAGQVTPGVGIALRPVNALTAACPDGVVPAPAFGDTGGNVHAPAIDCVAWWEIAHGTGAGVYSPTRVVRRDQMASFIARLLTAAGMPLPANPPNAFSDDEGNSHERAINQLAAIGVVGGTGGGRYSPAAAVRREQMATFLVNAYEEATGLTLHSAADGPVDHFTDDAASAHQANINRAAEADFTTGTAAGGFAPTATVRRDQMASFLARVLDRLVWDGFL